MTRTPHGLLLAALLATSGTVALAQTPPAPAAGDAAPHHAAGERRDHMKKDPAEMRQRMAERHEHRMAELKSQLKITSDQGAAWDTFAVAMKPPARPERPPMSRAEFDKLTTPERIDLMQKRRAERDQQMNQRADAVKAFYAQLTPEQQKTFDAQARHFGPHGGPLDHWRDHQRDARH